MSDNFRDDPFTDPFTEDAVTEDAVTEDAVTEDPVTEDAFTEDPFTEDTVHRGDPCGDPTVLVSYLYGACDPDEREVIAAHLATCVACAAEIEALDAARRMLPAWTPPAAALGFRIGSGEGGPVHVLRPARWWQRPLPAWAQAAAAVAIFMAGVSAGGGREPTAPAGGRSDGPAGPAEVVTPSTAADSSVTAPSMSASAMTGPVGAEPSRLGVAPAPAAVPAVTQDDLMRLERDLRAELGRIERAQGTGGTGLLRAADALPENTVTMARVEALIEESERRQRGELIQGMAQVLTDVDVRRRRDVEAMQRTVAGLGRETMSNRNSVAALANVVSTQSGFRPVSGR